jgi:hypothetical protein
MVVRDVLDDLAFAPLLRGVVGCFFREYREDRRCRCSSFEDRSVGGTFVGLGGAVKGN